MILIIWTTYKSFIFSKVYITWFEIKWEFERFREKRTETLESLDSLTLEVNGIKAAPIH